MKGHTVFYEFAYMKNAVEQIPRSREQAGPGADDREPLL